MPTDLHAVPWGRGEWCAAADAGLLVVVSLWDWYGSTWQDPEQDSSLLQQSMYNAWQMSGVWSVAVILAVGAAMLWIINRPGPVVGPAAAPVVVWRWSRRRQLWRTASLALVTFGIVLLVWQWSDLGPPSAAELAELKRQALAEARARFERENTAVLVHMVFVEEMPGYSEGAGPGFFAALLVLVLQAALMAAELLPPVQWWREWRRRWFPGPLES